MSLNNSMHHIEENEMVEWRKEKISSQQNHDEANLFIYFSLSIICHFFRVVTMKKTSSSIYVCGGGADGGECVFPQNLVD